MIPEVAGSMLSHCFRLRLDFLLSYPCSVYTVSDASFVMLVETVPTSVQSPMPMLSVSTTSAFTTLIAFSDRKIPAFSRKAARALA